MTSTWCPMPPRATRAARLTLRHGAIGRDEVAEVIADQQQDAVRPGHVRPACRLVRRRPLRPVRCARQHGCVASPAAVTPPGRGPAGGRPRVVPYRFATKTGRDGPSTALRRKSAAARGPRSPPLRRTTRPRPPGAEASAMSPAAARRSATAMERGASDELSRVRLVEIEHHGRWERRRITRLLHCCRP